MHLLNVFTRKLESFDDEDDIPPYAILSHTWGEEEVLFSHIEGSKNARHEGTKRKGFAKITGASIQAIKDGWNYIWIDTCCINKESSAELSEAINSMYKWYQKAEVCYVYLEDVYSSMHNQKASLKTSKWMGATKRIALPNWMKVMKEEDSSIEIEEDKPFEMVPFEHSRWFSRGWTLQELLAPQYIVFYSTDWIDIGTKSSLRDIISVTTGIRVEMLIAYDPIKASVAERMSWAACRKTTRKEDIAYCLMGLFGVNMPLLYGEGNRAFRRLQEEIMKVSDDHSLFAWRGRYSDYTIPDSGVSLFNKNHKVRGLLADSPWDFRDGVDIVPSDGSAFSPYSMTNQGLQIQLPLQPIDPECDLLDIDTDHRKNVFKATLKCTIRDKQPIRWTFIYLKMIRKGYYTRVFPHLLNETETNPNESELTSLLVPQVDTSATYNILKSQDIRMKTLPTESGFTAEGHSLVEGYEHSDVTDLSIGVKPEVTVFDDLNGKCFAVVIGFKDRLFWLDIVDVNKEWGHPQGYKAFQDDLKQTYDEGGRRYDIVLQHLDRLSVKISGWSVVVSAKKFNDRGGRHLRITVDIQRVPILSRGWYTPSPVSASDSFDGDLTGYLYGYYVVHPDFKKERGDWIAIFNPKAKRTLDVSPVHSITCRPLRAISEGFGMDLVQFSPDGKHLAVRYWGRETRIYDINTGEQCVLFDGMDTFYNIMSVCFSPNGKFLATGDINGRIVFWDIEKWDIHKVLGGYQEFHGLLFSLCFSLDSRLMVSGLGYGTIQIWDIVADETLHIFTLDHKSLVRSVAISRNGRLVAGGCNSDTIWIWDMTTKQLVKKLEGYHDVVFTPDGKRIVVGGVRGLLVVSLDVENLVPSQVMGVMEGSNGAEPDDSHSRTAILAQGKTSQRIICKSFVTSVAVSSDGQWVISGSGDGSVQFWDLEEGTVQFMLQGHASPINSVDMSPVDNIFATGSVDSRRVRIWRYDTT